LNTVVQCHRSATGIPPCPRRPQEPENHLHPLLSRTVFFNFTKGKS
jgi:hypothetical protein